MPIINLQRRLVEGQLPPVVALEPLELLLEKLGRIVLHPHRLDLGSRGVEFRQPTEALYVENLDTIPFPAWDLVNMAGYLEHAKPHDRVRRRP